MKSLLRKLPIVVVVIGLFLAGCGVSPKKEGALYKAGTYEGSGKGIHGDIKLSVSFSGSEITDIEVLESHETEGISDPAFERIPGEIVRYQSLGIDTVSGCTYSSKGILEAVADAVEKAGGDPAALTKVPVAKTGAGEKIEKTVDVIIVGGGGAGIAAASSAAENGAKVVIVEKTAALGGNTLASGLAMNAADPEVQKDMKSLTGQDTTLEKVLSYDEKDFGEFADTLKTLKKQIREYLAGERTYLFDSVEWHMIQTYLGGKRVDLAGKHYEGKLDLLSTLCGKSLETYHWLGNVIGIPLSDIIGSPVGSMWIRGHNFRTKPGVFIYARAYIENHGGEIMLETRAQHLIIEDGVVTGITGKKLDGTEVVLHARKSVVITTGGFGANGDMVRTYNTYWPKIPEGIKSTCVASATGDGINLGLEAGANVVDMGVTQLMPTASAFTGALTDGLLVAPQNYVFVNKEGRRFVNEYSERDVLASAVLQQSDGLFFTIADQPMAGTVQNHATQKDIDTMVEKGLIYKADTLAGLADKIGCNQDVFEKTISKYNSCVDTGEDPEFGKNVFEMKVETPPFYAVPSRPAVHHTMGGLQINTNAEVLGTSGAPVPGLFAAGEVTGGIHAGNRLGGNAIADCMVFGKIAGKNAALQK